jgi:hypothetical protein
MPHQSGIFIVVSRTGRSYLDETGSRFLPMPPLEGDVGRGYCRPDGAYIAPYGPALEACREARRRHDDAAHLVQIRPGDPMMPLARNPFPTDAVPCEAPGCGSPATCIHSVWDGENRATVRCYCDEHAPDGSTPIDHDATEDMRR